jgi:hypothetical protein
MVSALFHLFKLGSLQKQGDSFKNDFSTSTNPSKITFSGITPLFVVP